LSKRLKSFDDTGLLIPSHGLTPSLSATQAQASLNCIYNAHIDNSRFSSDIRKLQQMFHTFAAYAPTPWPAHGLKITPEIIYQSELWLPIQQIRSAFYRSTAAHSAIPPYTAAPLSGGRQAGRHCWTHCRTFSTGIQSCGVAVIAAG
jgi:hypothetical protein